MKHKNFILNLILTLFICGCKYSPKKVTPIFPDFSKQTVNTFRVKQVEPLEFEVAEQGVPFSEVERRQINKDLEPLVCFPISQVQEMRRAWENDGNNKVHNTVDANTNSENDATTREARDVDYETAGQ